MTKDEFEDAKTLWKMIYAYHCFRNAENACSFILNEKMDENHPVYYSLVTSIYVLCGKLFQAQQRRRKACRRHCPTKHPPAT